MCKLTVIFSLFVLFTTVIMISSCDSSNGGIENTEDNQVFITDRDGREWNVTHARDTSGMQPSYFNFGIGVDAIPSVDNPEILTEGDAGYPFADDEMAVFGVDHNGEQRAYPVSDLNRHEVFNDIFPGTSNRYIAVTF